MPYPTMARLLLVALLAFVALPVTAQTVAAQQAASGASTQPATAIDPALVGQWELVEVEAEGRMAPFEATVETMTCHFGADGEASVGLTLDQDADTYTRERTFRFVAADGTLLADGQNPATYEVLEGDEMRLTMADGFAARFRRADR